MLTPEQIHAAIHYIRRAVLRNWRLAGGVAGGVLLVTFIGIVIQPRAYFSEAQFFVRFGRENLMLDPTATTGQMISIYESRENEINSLLEVLKSRGMLDRLVDSLGPEYVLSGRGEPLAHRAGSASAAAPKSSPAKPSSAHQQAAQHLEKSIEIWVPRKSNIISVRCQATRPATAQQITARLIEIYLEEYVRVHRTAGSYQFFVDQTRLSKNEWQQSAARLGEAKDKLGIVTIDGKKKQLQDEITDIDARLLANRSDLKTAEARIASLEELIAKLPENDNLRGTLFQLEAREVEVAATRSDNHPQLMAVRQQLADLRDMISKLPPLRVQATQAVHPSRQALELNLLTDQSQAAAMRGREQALVALAAKLRGDLKQLNSQEATLGQLQQEVDLAEARHKAYADKLEQARINRSLDEERISSLTVVQPASYPTKPTGPRRAYVLALGMLVAAASGLAAALIAAYFQPILTTRDDLERLWDVPLIGVLRPLGERPVAAV